MRLNTDGASKGNLGNAGACGLIRGHKVELFKMFASSCGTCSCNTAKLWDVLWSLVIVSIGGYRLVKLTIDSEVVVRLYYW